MINFETITTDLILKEMKKLEIEVNYDDDFEILVSKLYENFPFSFLNNSFELFVKLVLLGMVVEKILRKNEEQQNDN